MPGTPADFSQLGAVFDDATHFLEGGVWQNAVEVGNQGTGSITKVVADLQAVQTGMQHLIDANTFAGSTLIHAQEIVSQLNLEIEAVQESLNGGKPANNLQGAVGSGTVFGANANRAVNDIHRDIIDIVQADPALVALANGSGFKAVPDILSSTQFADNAAQTAFISRWVSDSSSLGQRAEKLVGSGDQAAIDTLIHDIESFKSGANDFVNAQGGVFAARFANEMAANGNAGVAANDLIVGFQKGNADLVTVAAEALANNAADANGNNAPVGTTPHSGLSAATAPGHNLAEIGAIFNDATTMMIGGIDPSDKARIMADLKTTQTDLRHLIHDNPELFGGLTGIHANAIVKQLTLEMHTLNDVGINPDAPRELNDIQLDIIDIAKGDANLANMALQGGTAGFQGVPEALAPTPKYQDNAAQTDFWAHFIAQSNALGQQAEHLVGFGTKAEITALIHQIQGFNDYTANFDAAQGGIFGARFDNELLKTGTLGAEVQAIIHGLKTGNAALVSAAAEQMHANAADVGGNNVPITSGTYNPDGTTVADVLSTALAAAAPNAAPDAAPNNTPPPAGAPASAPSAATGPAAPGTGTAEAGTIVTATATTIAHTALAALMPNPSGSAGPHATPHASTHVVGDNSAHHDVMQMDLAHAQIAQIEHLWH
jgi:hypothetical protein